MTLISDTYTQPGGGTVPGQANQSLIDALSKVSGMSPQQLQQGQLTGQAQESAMIGQYPQYIRGVTQNVMQQAGIPGLQQGQADMSKIFDLYLHDQGLAAKSASQVAGGGNIGMGTGVTPVPTAETYQQTPTQILADKNVSLPPNPSVVSANMAAPLNSASYISDLLGKAADSVKSNIVGPAVTNASDEYNRQLNTLGSLVNMFSQERDRQQNLALAVMRLGGSVSARKVQAQQTISDYLDSNASPDDGYVSPDIWREAKKEAARNGINGKQFDDLYKGDYTNPKNPNYTFHKSASEIKLDTTTQDKVDSIKGFGNLVNSYYSNLQHFGPAASIIDPNARGKYEADKLVYSGKLQKSLGASRGKTFLDNLMKSLPNENLAIGGEGQLRGHLQSVLDANGLMLVRESSGQTGVTDNTHYDQNSESIVDINSEPMDSLRSILGGL